MLTIKDEPLSTSSNFEGSFLRFSLECKYLYINQNRKTLLVYDLESKDSSINNNDGDAKIISNSKINVSIPPSMYECILNVGIDEYDLNESLVAAKKTDFRNIDVFPLKMLLELAD